MTIALLVCLVLVCILPIAIVIGLIGFAAESFFAVLALAFSVLLPVIGLISILFFICAALKKRKLFIAGAFILLIGRVIVLLFNILTAPAPMLPEIREIGTAYFGTSRYEEHLFGGEWEKEAELSTEDISYVQALYDEINSHEFKLSFKELIPEEEGSVKYSARLFGKDGRNISNISFYGTEYISIGKGLSERFYKIEGEEQLDPAPMLKLLQESNGRQ